MKRSLIVPFFIVFLLTTTPCFADEGPRLRKTNTDTNITTMAQIEPNATGWYGPYYVSWLEYSLDELYIEFTSGVWVLLTRNYYDLAPLAALATSCRNHSRRLYVQVINNVPYGFQIQ